MNHSATPGKDELDSIWSESHQVKPGEWYSTYKAPKALRDYINQALSHQLERLMEQKVEYSDDYMVLGEAVPLPVLQKELKNLKGAERL